MEILEIREFPGRNIYCHRPAVKMTLDLGKYGGIESREIPHFNQDLKKILPTIVEHGCGIAEVNGFGIRLDEGTYFGHIIEHIAIELQNKVGYEVNYGKTRLYEKPSCYYVITECKNTNVGREALKIAVEMAQSIINNEQTTGEYWLAKMDEVKSTYGLGPSTESIYSAAQKRNIPVKRLDDNSSMLQLGLGKYLKRVEATITGDTSCVAVDIASDKTLTKRILEKSGIPVPYGKIASNEDEAVDLAKKVGVPVVLKPCDGNQGKGVALGLSTETEIRSAYKVAENYSDRVIVEKHVNGKHYRVLVINDEVVAVSERLPAHVTGDGIHTIKELIEKENLNPLRGEDHDKPLTKIKVDPVVFMALARQNLTMNYTPKDKEVVYLRENANISTGGIAIDVTEEIHPDNIRLAKRLAKIIGLDIAGIDIVVDDIANPMTKENGAIIEVNAAPGIRMHLHPSHGKPIKVGEKIVNYLFPKNANHTIPIVSITGTNGKTTTTRLISHTLRGKNINVGMTTTDGIYVNDTLIEKGDTTGPFSAAVVLDDPTTDVAVLETARGGIVKRGLGYDLADVAVITNLSEDHIGQDGVNSLEDLFFVKSLVAEAVKPSGSLVLNADDPYVVRMADRNKKAKVIYFSIQPTENQVFKRHIAAGGKGIFIKNNNIIIAEGNKNTITLPLEKIPITLKGQALHNVKNVMAAIGANLALNNSLEKVKEKLCNFDGQKHNPGRCNVFEAEGITVVVDYGHNKDGYIETFKFAKGLKPNRLLSVLGVPGDRVDDDIVEMGAIAAKTCQFLILKEDKELRGRKRGEVADLFEQGLIREGTSKNSYKTVLPEDEAIREALNMCQKGDVLVIFYEDLELTGKVVEECLANKGKNKVASMG
ncbi:cyanophycin synthetase [Proteinivorax hydrogeniformans]|uniref:Cyanophycin synthetase n=1 Tax=Proteinivorax hydrogeniformans TaxID=1826727 RepID=A0AAU8HTI9_9FIRM